MGIPTEQIGSSEHKNIHSSADTLPLMSTKQVQSYTVLARKYRPVGFDDLIGQDVMVKTLRNAFALNRVAHAFMLTGVRGVGKTTSARIIARALNCVGIDGTGGATSEPCGQCPNCKAILADRHPDVLEIDAASHTGVDDVREIIENSRFRPIQARMKVYIIDEVHMLSRNAFNALLKILEEPPNQVTFIFATTEIRKVPVTVLSRCQRFDLKRIMQRQLKEFFLQIAQQEKINITEDAANLIARASDGSARDGLSILDQAIAQSGVENEIKAIDALTISGLLGFTDRAFIFELFEAIMSGQSQRVLLLAEQAYENGVDVSVLLPDLLEVINLVSRMKSLPELSSSSDFTEIEREKGSLFAEKLSIPVLSRAWQMVLKGINEVHAAPNRKIAVEMVLIRLCYVSDLPTPDQLAHQIKNNVDHPTNPLSNGSQSNVSKHQSLAGNDSLEASLNVSPTEELKKKMNF